MFDGLTSHTPRLSHTVTKVARLYNPRTWKEKGLWWTSGLFLMTYLVIVTVLGILWSGSPGPFDVRQHALGLVGNDPAKLVPGAVTAATAIGIAETLLNKPGGYLTNDITPPGVYLDNIPNWEFGALTELRDLSSALRNDFSRAQTQSVEDVDLLIAEPQFNYDADSWIFPSTESEYRGGVAGLRRYLLRLGDAQQDNGQFFARADNLTAYLQVVGKRLGSLGQRLSYAVGQAHLDTALAGDPNARQSTPVPSQAVTKTPWLKIDDYFFEARGYTWALLQSLKAMEIDFAPVLQDKNAVVSLKQIIRELENTQNVIWSPAILNGTGFGPMANHSLVMASYISRANAAIIDLRNLLVQG
ncbi:DUF2333 family protein [Candidatus Thiodictyon syntrophicum]|jgi:hypothetical protein|uniref:DUF2333 domain-containing protein n=1 Tax=Candidatus Thiodictyon syntrophicum TaxID=1166950 RepID=A0A2K8UBD1_9GAMM|nr:DUF2333 family protein [Candidatus Thiodictyon syntrophicum]AUB82855.1 hypothetical protein THSYN_19185 [Candidatus Thiodictyon syntrophicum]